MNTSVYKIDINKKAKFIKQRKLSLKLIKNRMDKKEDSNKREIQI